MSGKKTLYYLIGLLYKTYEMLKLRFFLNIIFIEPLNLRKRQQIEKQCKRTQNTMEI